MSKLNVDQSTIGRLFQDKKSDFLIPDYQRPYAWTEEECQTLWEDIFEFALPGEDYTKFNNDDEYYLGPIVTFKNEDGKLEVIDGQQRLTTLMLLLRAFHVRFGKMADPNSIKTKENIEKCIWKTDEFGFPNKDELKIDSEVATDNDKEEFLNILRTGEASKNINKNNRYASNYKFFQEKIEKFLQDYPTFFSYLPTRILNNCILLPIEADNQNTALRIFSTLNDRGLPLSDADIFKAQFYKYYSDKGQKDEFISKWKELEEISDRIFHPSTGTPMDELFTRYMYYLRAKQGIKRSTTEALRRFYEKDSYQLLKNDEAMKNLKSLADFWDDITNQNNERFSERVLRRLFVLNYAPNGMWNYFLSVYFLQNRDSNDLLDDDKLFDFLNKIIAFIWAYAIYNPGVNALRTPVYAEMVNIVNDKEVTFNESKFEEEHIRSIIENYSFYNRRPITKSMLAWWSFENEEQTLMPLETIIEVEHIYAKKRQEIEKGLSAERYIELLGNKSLLEKKINIRVSDYRFEDKRKLYNGYVNDKGIAKAGTMIVDLKELAQTFDDFTEEDILKRNKIIIDKFIENLRNNNLLK